MELNKNCVDTSNNSQSAFVAKTGDLKTGFAKRPGWILCGGDSAAWRECGVAREVIRAGCLWRGSVISGPARA